MRPIIVGGKRGQYLLVCLKNGETIGKIIKDGALSDIPSIHRITIDGAAMRKKLREERKLIL